MPGQPAVFIDRDGTLTEQVGYVNHPRRLRLLPRSAEAIRRLNRAARRAVMRRAVADLGLDLSRSWVVGDEIIDITAGRRAGARSILALTGYGLGEWEYRRSLWPSEPDHVAEDLLDAVDPTLARSER